MQKTLSFSLSLGLVLAITACDKKNKATSAPGQSAQTQHEAPAQQGTNAGLASDKKPATLPLLTCRGTGPDWTFELTPSGKLKWSPKGGERGQLDVTSVLADRDNSWTVTLSSPTVLKSVIVTKKECSSSATMAKAPYSALLANAQGDTLKGCCNPAQ